MRRTAAALVAVALVAGGLLAAPASTAYAAAPTEELPLGRTVLDPRGDAEGASGARQYADLTRVRYQAARPSNEYLRISVRYPRLAPERRGAVRQSFTTLLDGPGRRDWRIDLTARNGVRVVFLGGDDGPERITPADGYITVSSSSAGDGEYEVAVTTEWLTAKRARFTTISRVGDRAVDVTRTTNAIRLDRG